MYSPQHATEEILAAEKQLLAFLLAETAPPEIVRSILVRLTSYRFQSVEHQVLFECVARLSERPANELFASLPAHLVRAGFPDFDLDRFRSQSPVRAEQADALCRRLATERSL